MHLPVEGLLLCVFGLFGLLRSLRSDASAVSRLVGLLVGVLLLVGGISTLA